MSYIAFLLVIFSALMHASYNFAYKKSELKTIYLWSMFTVSILLMTVIAIFIKSSGFFNLKTIALASLSAIFFSLYQLSTGKAYSLASGDMSIVYPLSITAPLYIPFLAYIIIGEKITITTFAGIVLALFGTYLIQLNTPLKELKLKKINLKEKHIRYALFAGFIYSFGAIVDKIGVGKHNFFVYTYWVILLMFIYMSVNILVKPALRKNMFYCHVKNPAHVLLGGFFMTLSFLSYRCAMQLTQVSAVAGARQISSLFGVLMGIFLLKEPYGSLRFMATILIIAGVILIKIG